MLCLRFDIFSQREKITTKLGDFKVSVFILRSVMCYVLVR